MKRRLLKDYKPITAAIPFETIEKLDKTADRLKVTRSIVIRAALDQYLEKQIS